MENNTVIKRSPFKFLDSYQEEDADIFFGREKETEQLYAALSGVKHLLVYGPSGAGKTSLIECGLRNQFSDADWFALTIRRQNNILHSFYRLVNGLLEDKALELDPETGLPANSKEGFKDAVGGLFSEYYRPVYLLFDQFEELLILGSKEEKEAFFIQLNELIRFGLPCRVILSMREEFIGHLSEFEHLCPSIFQHRFRLEKMRKTNVQAVLLGILDADYYADYFDVKEPELLAEAILEHLPDQSLEIELTHVQVFLNELWERAAAKNPNGLPVLEKGLIRDEDNLETVLAQFLKKQLKELDEKFGKDIPLELLACMISSQNTKLLLSQKELADNLASNDVHLKEGNTIQELLKELEKYRIVRIQESTNTENKYEIAHDLLALLVGQNLTDAIKLRDKASDIYKVYLEKKGLLSQDDLDFLRPYKAYKAYPPALLELIEKSERAIKEQYENELKEIQAQARKERGLREAAEKAKDEAVENEQRAKQRTRVALILFVLAIGTSAFAFMQWDTAVKTSKKNMKLEREARKKEREEAEREKQAKILAELDETRDKYIEYKAKGNIFMASESYTAAIHEFDKALIFLENDTFDNSGKSVQTSLEKAKKLIGGEATYNDLISAGTGKLQKAKQIYDGGGLNASTLEEVKNLLNIAYNDFSKAKRLNISNVKNGQAKNNLSRVKDLMGKLYEEAISSANRFASSRCDLAKNRLDIAKSLEQYIDSATKKSQKSIIQKIKKTCD